MLQGGFYWNDRETIITAPTWQGIYGKQYSHLIIHIFPSSPPSIPAFHLSLDKNIDAIVLIVRNIEINQQP